MADRPEPSAFDVGNALFNECAYAFQFINSGVREVLEGTLPPAHRPGWHRSLAWVSTLQRLTSPADFQAVFGACRSLLEIVVDTALIDHLPNGAKLTADWELSAKLKQAQALARYYANRPPPNDAQHAIAFATREANRIDAIRVANGWTTDKGKPRHPDRWTGNNLGNDTKTADGFEPGLGLEELYETKYRPMCWYVHGSGAVGLSDIPTERFPALGGLMFRTCSLLAVAHAQLLLRIAKQWDVPYLNGAWADHFARLARVQKLAAHAAMFGEPEE